MLQTLTATPRALRDGGQGHHLRAIAKALGISPMAVTRAPSENPRSIESHVVGS